MMGEWGGGKRVRVRNRGGGDDEACTCDCQDDLSVSVQYPSDLVCQLKRDGLVSVEVSDTAVDMQSEGDGPEKER
jgi:hypothetical protein